MPTNTPPVNAAVERIELPNGYYLEPFTMDGVHEGYDLCSSEGVMVFGDDKMGIPQAKAFAEAMKQNKQKDL